MTPETWWLMSKIFAGIAVVGWLGVIWLRVEIWQIDRLLAQLPPREPRR